MYVILGALPNPHHQFVNLTMSMKSKSIFLFLLIFSVLSLACANGKQSGKTVKIDKDIALSQIYGNDYFSIKYPSTYRAESNFGCKPASMEELREMDADSIMAMPMNELYIVPKSSNLNWSNPEVYIVLSRHKLDFPIRMFMDLSIYTKEQPNSDNLPLIGYSDVDSISFAGFPALEVEFAYKGERGDTLVQHQIIVQTPDYSLYYLNNKYNLSNPESYELGEKILSTFKFTN